MLSIVKSIALNGIEGYLVEVQVDVAEGIPSWEVVGLPDITVKEAKERVKIAIKNSKIKLSSKRVTINLAPANLRKEGSFYDLPIAIGILMSTEYILSQDLKNTVFIGELSLDGKINKVNGVLPMCIEAKKLGVKRVIISEQNAKEAAMVDEIEVIPVNNLIQTIKYLNSQISINAQENNIEEIFSQNQLYSLDFSEVKGQENAKRALEVAASGGHNCLLVGSPGCGKTMLAKRIPTILPKLTFEEALEVTKIHSVAGNLSNDIPIISTRQFRNPHHTISKSSLIGGGRIPKPGEVSLAHNGVLFLDELPEFNKDVLEVLRVPIEDRRVTLSRVLSTVTYPCSFMLIVSMNPCMCGYYGSDKQCKCTQESIRRYIGKISGPMLDRIDIQIEVNSVKYDKFNTEEKAETSKEIQKRVNLAREIQQERYKKYGIFSNAELTPKLIEKYCKLDESSKAILENAFNRLGLSARAYERILKVSRTIADMEEKENIGKNHILESISYRSLDKKYWRV